MYNVSVGFCTALRLVDNFFLKQVLRVVTHLKIFRCGTPELFVGGTPMRSIRRLPRRVRSDDNFISRMTHEQQAASPKYRRFTNLPDCRRTSKQSAAASYVARGSKYGYAIRDDHAGDDPRRVVCYGESA